MSLTPAEQALNAKIEAEGLHLKHDTQLVFMRDSHAEKLLRVAPDLDKALNFPDAIRWELKEAEYPADEIEQEVADQKAYYQWKQTRLTEIVSFIDTEIGFRADGKVNRKPVGTTFFIDSVNGNDANDGLTTGAAFATLDKFTETARSAGDKAILRRGLGTDYDDGTDLLFTSDGMVDNPIIIEADYANAFSDDVDLSATATATLTFGSKIITFSSDISGVLAAGDWIYAAGDDAKEFAYEVDSVSTVTVTLFLPYKGGQAGSGKTMTNMQSPPIWNTAAGVFQWNFDGDNFWQVQGIHIRGTDSLGNVEMDGCAGHVFRDCIFEGSANNDFGLRTSDDASVFEVLKCRFFNHEGGIDGFLGSGSSGLAHIKDCLFDGNSVLGGGILTKTWSRFVIEESEFKNYGQGDIVVVTGESQSSVVIGRNLILSSATEVDVHDTAEYTKVLLEDHDGVLNDTRQLTGFSTAEGTPSIQSETTTVRSGGSTISIKVTPSTKLSTNWELSRLLLFEIPIYATVDSKTYTVYFASDDIAEWTANPTAGELWIELEYWGHVSNNFRRITKSTGTIDLKTDTDFDQTLAITIAPSQAGVAYLRCYYAKTKESGKTNIFYVDPLVAIS